MKIKEVSKATDLSEKTIRYYEECGLIQPDYTDKNGRNFRDYSVDTVDRLKSIAILRKMMFSINEIKDMDLHPDNITAIMLSYQQRIKEELDERENILDAVQKLSLETIDNFNTLSESLKTVASKRELPRCDIHPNFARLDHDEEVTRDHFFTKPSPLPYKLKPLEMYIMSILWEKPHDFTSICHAIISKGISKDTNSINKVIRRMERKKVLSEKDGLYYPLLAKEDLTPDDINKFIQTAATGTNELLLVYSPVPPMGVSSSGNQISI